MKSVFVCLAGTTIVLSIGSARADLIHQWNFNESTGTTAANAVSGGPSATLQGQAAFNGTGGVTLNGTSGTYINLGNSLLSGLSSVTFAAWFSHTGVNNTHLFTFDNNNGTGSGGTFLRYNVGDTGNGHGGNDFIESVVNWGGHTEHGTGLAANTALHVAVVYDPASNSESIYVNGALTASYSGTLPALSSYATFNGALGRSPWTSDPRLNGVIDQFGIYNSALTGEEIAALYAAGPSGPDLSDNDGDGLPATWETANGLDDNDDGTINPDNGAAGDPDGDTHDNLAEYNAGSNPQNPDSVPGDVDGDLLPDSWETTHFGNLSADTFDDPDGDYGTNIDEYEDGTDPNDRLSTIDVDGGSPDGMGDYWEEWFFGNTSRDGTGDFDNDSVSDLDEWTGNTEPDNSSDPYPGVTSIAWSSPVTITADSDILASGSLVHAGNFRSDNANVTVAAGSESILFANRQAQDAAGNLQAGEEARIIAGAGGRQVNAALFDATGTAVSTTFESVLDGSAWENGDAGPAPGATDMVLRVTGADGTPLVEGQEYQIQLFYSDDRPTSATRAQRYHDGKGNASDSFLAPSSSAVVGTFTATSAGYMDIYVQNTSGGANFPVGLNAYVLRTVASGNDSDSDGMDDTWETTHFGNTSQPATGDFDGDGTDNLTEFRLGLVPNNGGSSFAATRSAAGLLEWPGVEGVTFTVQRSTTLADGSWSDIATIPGTAGTASFSDPSPPVGAAFYRILLEP
jgi:hypothetical protein